MINDNQSKKRINREQTREEMRTKEMKSHVKMRETEDDSRENIIKIEKRIYEKIEKH
jgi:hypothetical protein